MHGNTSTTMIVPQKALQAWKRYHINIIIKIPNHKTPRRNHTVPEENIPEKLKNQEIINKNKYINIKPHIERNGRIQEQILEQQDKGNTYNPGYRASLLSHARGKGSSKKAPKLLLS